MSYKRREIVTIKRDAAGNYTYRPRIGIQNACKLRVKKVMAVQCSFNITSQNWNLIVDEGGPDIPVVVPEGRYDPLSLAAAFDAAVVTSTLAATCVTTYSYETHKFTFTWSAPVDMKFNSASSTLHRALGFDQVDTGDASVHVSTRCAEIDPPFWYLHSDVLGSGRKSSGGGGGTQVSSAEVLGSPQNLVTTVPNQVDGSLLNFIYVNREADGETFLYNAPRQIDEFDLELRHPWYPTDEQSVWWDPNASITFELEFECQYRFK